MDPGEEKKLKRKILVLVPTTCVVLALFLFVPAGTFDYWEAWVYCAVILIPYFIVLATLIKKNPELLVRRLRLNEKEPAQRRIVKASSLIFVIGFLLPGLDRRFGWSDIPVEAVLAADILVILGYALVFLVFLANPFTSRTVEVEPGQKVISTGPYAIVRHPMYLGMCIMWLATPVARLLLGAFCIPRHAGSHGVPDPERGRGPPAGAAGIPGIYGGCPVPAHPGRLVAGIGRDRTVLALRPHQ